MRVEALWKIMPERAARAEAVRHAPVLRRFERQTEVEQAVELLAAQVPRAQKIAPGERGGRRRQPVCMIIHLNARVYE